MVCLHLGDIGAVNDQHMGIQRHMLGLIRTEEFVKLMHVTSIFELSAFKYYKHDKV